MKKSKGRIVFEVINVIVLSLLSFACLFPLLNILAMSFSSSTAAVSYTHLPGYTRSIRPARTLKHPDIRAIVGAKPTCSSVLT